MAEKEKSGAQQELFLAPQTEIVETNTVTETKDTENKKENKKGVRVNEIRQLRTENRKVFRMSDGTQQAVFYPKAIHVLDDETHEFEEMDTTISLEEDGEHYCSGKGKFKARFCCKENDELFSIEQGMHKVALFAKTNKGKCVKPVLKKAAVQDGKTETSVVFEKAHKDADYKYNVTSNGVKENIIVTKKAESYRYPFIMECVNVTAQFDEENKRVSFLSNETGKEVFYIPSPVMCDANGVTSCEVDYELKELENGKLQFTVMADSQWINDQARAFPVAIDPQIAISNSSYMSIYSWSNGTMSQTSGYTLGMLTDACNINYEYRMYLKLTKPNLPRNVRIKKAELVLPVGSGNSTTSNAKIGLYKVGGSIYSGNCTPSYNSEIIDYFKPECFAKCTNLTFNVTDIVDKLCYNETSYQGLMVKFMDSISTGTYLFLTGNNAAYPPTLNITYESNCGVNNKYRTHTHELGRFGTGIIDLACGNLMFESEDFAWAGNRMPVTIKHLYNSAICNSQFTANSTELANVADFSAMKIGNGFKLNIMQSMVYNANLDKYIFVDENGGETYFKRGTKTLVDRLGCYYNPYVNENDEDDVYDPTTYTLSQGDTKYLFNSTGKLIRITDENGNYMTITYSGNKLTSVTDGAGREFEFNYSGKYLTSITAPDESAITYAYDGDYLKRVTYPDGRKAEITYTDNKPLLVTLYNADNTPVYRMQYMFFFNRVSSVIEYGVNNGTFETGTSVSYNYSAAANKTHVVITEMVDYDTCQTESTYATYTFDDDGELIGEYSYGVDNEKKAVSGGSGINPYDAETKAQSNIDNLLADHAFNRCSSSGTSTDWLKKERYSGMLKIKRDTYSEFGNRCLYIDTDNVICEEHGIYQNVSTLTKGDYTFSAYLRIFKEFDCIENPAVFLRVVTSSGTVIAESERIFEKSDSFVRLIAPFRLDVAQTVQVQLLMVGAGVVCINAPQLEKNGFANRYNHIENGNFEQEDTGWKNAKNAQVVTTQSFNMSKSLCLTGNLNGKSGIEQSIDVTGTYGTRETFTLSGWAMGNCLPTDNKDDAEKPEFSISATIVYDNGEKETYTADFSPCTEGWQPASVQFAKSKREYVAEIIVSCNYNYNVGKAYFDNISLFQDSIEKGLSEADFASTEVEESQEQTKTEEILSDFTEAKDFYGNALTETTFADGEFGTIYRSFTYNTKTTGLNNAGNDLISETDTRSNATSYTVNAITSRNEVVTDRCGNKTAYEYDADGKTTKVISKTSDDTELSNVSYTYDAFDNLTEITRGDGMKYSLKYNEFHRLEAIGIDGKTDGDLVTYTYKNGSGRLKTITYANGSAMEAVYNGEGQLIAEKWGYENNTLTVCYRYAYDNSGNLVRSIDINQRKEYNYIYQNDKIVRAVEYDITLNSAQNVTSKTVANTIEYNYDEQDRIIKKTVTVGNNKTEYYTEYPENSDPIVTMKINGLQAISHSKTDSFGRKEFDELQIGTGFVSRKFSYYQGEYSQKHAAYQKLKSTPTTNLVSRIELSDGRTLEYEYDNEERITKVTDSLDGVTEYTYDALGQLLTERHKAVDAEEFTDVNVMTYDNYGNILTKNGVQYTYDSVWKDKVTAIGNKALNYDASGNLFFYGGSNFSWDNHRRLSELDLFEDDGTFINSLSFTYNSNGIRISKQVRNVATHNYIVDGTKILKETWGNHTLIPLYDNQDNVCGALYDGYAFYFHKNLQGDVIAVVDQNNDVVARYSYDAWGKVTKTVYPHCFDFGEVNPFLYRGYYYDWETGLYYLNSRYYDPEMGRFISADDIDYLGAEKNILAYNLFSYCENDPINNIDYNGNISWSTLAKAISYIFDFFVQIATTAGSMSKEMAGIIKKIKRAKANGASKDWIKELKRKKNELISPKRLGVGKINAISKALGILVTVLPYLSYIKRIKDGIKVFAEIIVDLFLEILSITANFIVSLICKIIPYFGFILGWAMDIAIDLIISKVFNNSRLTKIKSIFYNRVKNSTSLKYWISSIGYSVSKCF